MAFLANLLIQSLEMNNGLNVSTQQKLPKPQKSLKIQTVCYSAKLFISFTCFNLEQVQPGGEGTGGDLSGANN